MKRASILGAALMALGGLVTPAIKSAERKVIVPVDVPFVAGKPKKSKGKGIFSGRSFRRRTGNKYLPHVGARQAERAARQGLQNVRVNGFELIQRA
jgi:hypothetical protein